MSDGNGESHLTRIQVVEIRPGWIVVRPQDELSADSPRLAQALNSTVINWLQERPKVTVQAALGIVSGGRTIAVQLWYAAEG